jgi:hypothetical protein
MQAFAAFNQFLVTPAGQKMAEDFEAVVAGLMNDLHIHISSTLPVGSPTAQKN